MPRSGKHALPLLPPQQHLTLHTALCGLGAHTVRSATPHQPQWALQHVSDMRQHIMAPAGPATLSQAATARGAVPCAMMAVGAMPKPAQLSGNGPPAVPRQSPGPAAAAAAASRRPWPKQPRRGLRRRQRVDCLLAEQAAAQALAVVRLRHGPHELPRHVHLGWVGWWWLWWW